jgi:hypothetical protein
MLYNKPKSGTISARLGRRNMIRRDATPGGSLKAGGFGDGPAHDAEPAWHFCRTIPKAGGLEAATRAPRSAVAHSQGRTLSQPRELSIMDTGLKRCCGGLSRPVDRPRTARYEGLLKSEVETMKRGIRDLLGPRGYRVRLREGGRI